MSRLEIPLRLHDEAFQELARPFLEVGALSHTDLAAVDALARRLGPAPPEVLLGLAFAVRAPRRGSVGARLGTLQQTLVAEEEARRPLDEEASRPADEEASRPADEEAEAEASPALLAGLPWPPDPASWEAAVRDCHLVGRGAPDELTPFVMRDGLLTTRRYWRYQERLQEALLARAAAPASGIAGAAPDLPRYRQGLVALFPESGARPADEVHPQRLAAGLALLRALTVVSGGPGTGKTYTVKLLLALLYDQWQAAHGRAPRVALAAPTGKAAVRMVQAMAEDLDEAPLRERLPLATRDWLRTLPASTLHRLLGYDPVHPTHFRHGPDTPLPFDIVVVDEASMIDLALMAKLLEAVPVSARLLLLGDRHQLASVEAGSVLADLTADAATRPPRLSPALRQELQQLGITGLPVADPAAPPLAGCLLHYRQPFRFSAESGIGQLAYSLADASAAELAGQDASAFLDRARDLLAGVVRQPTSEPYPDLRHLGPAPEGGLDQAALDAIVDGYLPYLDLLLAGPRQPSPADHRRVLDAFDQFRVLVAHRRGPLGVSGLNRTIAAALAQKYQAECDTHRWREPLRVDRDWWTGRPVLVTENSYEVGRFNGDVGVVVRVHGRPAIAFAGREAGEVEYLEPARMPAHQTVFAMTIHKSQGSQFAHTFLVLPARPSVLLTRELLYTAVTRSQQQLTVAGDLALLRSACERVVQRASGLRELLWSAGA
ncbi:MAG: exodeoxyribonuclease V subunit alpha [Myxococcota bacterium]|jgi:exodeoxyribonuclease V alpha subunit|nr:exodeoxyribonuclease V subunit alpha [Myxococcota bacterium]